MVNCHLGWSKVIWIGQLSLGLNGVDFDTLEAVIRKSLKLEGCYLQISLIKNIKKSFSTIF